MSRLKTTDSIENTRFEIVVYQTAEGIIPFEGWLLKLRDRQAKVYMSCGASIEQPWEISVTTRGWAMDWPNCVLITGLDIECITRKMATRSSCYCVPETSGPKRRIFSGPGNTGPTMNGGRNERYKTF